MKAYMARDSTSAGVFLDQKKYRDSFDPKKYLETFYRSPQEHKACTRTCVNLLRSLQKKDLKVLEFGSGPALLDLIPIVPFSREIVCTDYCQQNLLEVQQWLDKDPEAFDWSPFTKMVLEEEGLEATPEAVSRREEDLRRAITAVAHCDIAASLPVEERLSGPYDIVHCDGVLDAISGTMEDFFTGVATLSKLVRSGGCLIVGGGLDLSLSYTAGVEFQTPLLFREQDYCNAFERAGFVEIKTATYDEVYEAAGFSDRSVLVTGTKP